MVLASFDEVAKNLHLFDSKRTVGNYSFAIQTCALEILDTKSFIFLVQPYIGEVVFLFQSNENESPRTDFFSGMWHVNAEGYGHGEVIGDL